MPEIVLLSDPVIGQIAVDECGEDLVDLRDVPEIRLDPRLADPDGLYARLRKGVAERLVTAQALLPAGLRLLVTEGYRPPALQERYFDRRVNRLRAAHPERDRHWWRREASRYVSPPEVAPHVAGAAVDLTLCTLDGGELPMGTEVNDTSSEACHTACRHIPAEARQNRRLLVEALTAAGMVNYPTEWWHWSYGDRYWAYTTAAPAAQYGPVSLPG